MIANHIQVMSKEIAPNFSASDVSNIKKFSRRKKVIVNFYTSQLWEMFWKLISQNVSVSHVSKINKFSCCKKLIIIVKYWQLWKLSESISRFLNWICDQANQCTCAVAKKYFYYFSEILSSGNVIIIFFLMSLSKEFLYFYAPSLGWPVTSKQTVFCKNISPVKMLIFLC